MDLSSPELSESLISSTYSDGFEAGGSSDRRDKFDVTLPVDRASLGCDLALPDCIAALGSGWADEVFFDVGLVREYLRSGSVRYVEGDAPVAGTALFFVRLGTDALGWHCHCHSVA